MYTHDYNLVTKFLNDQERLLSTEHRLKGKTVWQDRYQQVGKFNVDRKGVQG